MSYQLLWQRGMEFLIDPDDELQYTFDWTDWLSTGAAIDSYTIIASDGVTVIDDAGTGTQVSVYVGGVAAGARETITCRVVTDETIPQQADRTIKLRGVEL